MPPGLGCMQIDGWGDFRMRFGSSEMAFSGEDAEWHVTIEGSIEDVEPTR